MTETSASRKPDGQEPSMDDILASIRRILAEDGAIGAQTPAADARPGPPAEPLSDALEEMRTGIRRSSLPTDPIDFDDQQEAEPPASLLPPAGLPAADAPAARSSEDVFVLSPDMRAAGSKLVSQRASEDSTDVLSQLARAILDRRDIAVATRDITLESMVREMLRPLLREWLDRNLPYLIERLVRKEIDLMVNRAERLED